LPVPGHLGDHLVVATVVLLNPSHHCLAKPLGVLTL